MFNISFMTCIKRYISHKSLEDQTLFGRNGFLTPHSVTQPPNLGLWLGRSSLVFIYFGQNVTRTKSHVFWQFVTRTQSHVSFQFFQLCIIFIQLMKRTIHSCIYFFLFFVLKKKSGDSIPLTQKDRCLKRYPNLFF